MAKQAVASAIGTIKSAQYALTNPTSPGRMFGGGDDMPRPKTVITNPNVKNRASSIQTDLGISDPL